MTYNSGEKTAGVTKVEGLTKIKNDYYEVDPEAVYQIDIDDDYDGNGITVKPDKEVTLSDFNGMNMYGVTINATGENLSANTLSAFLADGLTTTDYEMAEGYDYYVMRSL